MVQFYLYGKAAYTFNAIARSRMKNLAPNIYRQRAIIEGIAAKVITPEDIKSYLSELSNVLDMTALMEPVTHRSPLYGEAGWIHWETSGTHFYAWEKPFYFFSVDIYTCKEFAVEDAVHYTKDVFECKDDEIVYKEF